MGLFLKGPDHCSTLQSSHPFRLRVPIPISPCQVFTRIHALISGWAILRHDGGSLHCRPIDHQWTRVLKSFALAWKASQSQSSCSMCHQTYSCRVSLTVVSFARRWYASPGPCRLETREAARSYALVQQYYQAPLSFLLQVNAKTESRNRVSGHSSTNEYNHRGHHDPCQEGPCVIPDGWGSTDPSVNEWAFRCETPCS